MPVASSASERMLCPPGEHTMTLQQVEELTSENPFQGGAMQTRWAWRFTSNLTDPANGVPYRYTHWTGTAYGNPKAGLTLFYDSIMPGITLQQAVTFDTDTLLGRQFSVVIKHENDSKGQLRDRMVNIRTVPDASRPPLPNGRGLSPQEQALLSQSHDVAPTAAPAQNAPQGSAVVASEVSVKGAKDRFVASAVEHGFDAEALAAIVNLKQVIDALWPEFVPRGVLTLTAADFTRMTAELEAKLDPANGIGLDTIPHFDPFAAL